MSDIYGTNVASSIVPFSTEDTYATHDSTYGKGGWREVESLAERDAISLERRRVGMAVYVRENDTIYLLKNTTANTGWAVLSSGSTGSTYIHDQGEAASVWLVKHDMGKYPSVVVQDTAGSIVVGDIEYVDNNRVLLTFKGAFKGKAYCN